MRFLYGASDEHQRELRDVLMIRQGGRGKREPITPEMLLLLWETLVDVALKHLHEPAASIEVLSSRHGKAPSVAAGASITAQRFDGLSRGAGTLEVADLAKVLSWGWTSRQLLEQIEMLDYRTMEGLTPSHAGNPDQWLPVFIDHPESWRVLVNAERRVVGYWHFVSLFPEDFLQAKDGRLVDAALSSERLKSFEIPGIHQMYFAGFVVDVPLQRSRALRQLLECLGDGLDILAAEGIFFDEVCANAFTPSGESMCKTLGLAHRRRHADHGEVYCGNVTNVIEFLPRDQRLALRKRYATLKDF